MNMYEGMSQNERLEELKKNCNSKEKRRIQVFFSDDDMIEMKSRFVESSLKQIEIREEFAVAQSTFKKKMKEQTKKADGLLNYIADGYMYEEQEVYDFDDQENNVMRTYNCLGEQIAERPLTQKERQTRIKG